MRTNELAARDAAPHAALNASPLAGDGPLDRSAAQVSAPGHDRRGESEHDERADTRIDAHPGASRIERAISRGTGAVNALVATPVSINNASRSNASAPDGPRRDRGNVSGTSPTRC